MYRQKLHKRPISEVVKEYASFKGKVIIFWDDNIASDMEYASAITKASMSGFSSLEEGDEGFSKNIVLSVLQTVWFHAGHGPHVWMSKPLV
jgi:hypothetical protein